MHRLWSYRSSSAIRGLRLAREPGTLLVWDVNHLVTSLSNGTVTAQWHAPSPLTGAACADDGSAAVAVGATGQIWFLGADLKPRWQREIGGKALAVGIAPFGGVLAVAEGTGAIHFLDNNGHTFCKAANPRPLRYLEFLAERTLLIGSADFSSLAAFNLSGKCLWHDSPVANCGSLSVSGDGLLIALACFSEGLSLYDHRGKKVANSFKPGPCRLAVLSYDGTSILTVGLDGLIRLHDRQGKARSEYRPEAAVVAVDLDALGTTAFVGLADGTVMALAATR
jgi:hypothetical protein